MNFLFWLAVILCTFIAVFIIAGIVIAGPQAICDVMDGIIRMQYRCPCGYEVTHVVVRHVPQDMLCPQCKEHRLSAFAPIPPE